MDYLKFISEILSPTMVAMYVTIIFSLYSQLSVFNILLCIFIGNLFLSLIPTVSIYYLSKTGYADTEFSKRERRAIVYLIGLLCFVIASLIFWLLNFHIMFLISMAYVFVTSAVFIINLFWKISAHSAGVAGPTTALVYVFGPTLIPLYVVTLLVIWVRLKIKVHNLKQLIAGALIAIFITLLVYTILW